MKLNRLCLVLLILPSFCFALDLDEAHRLKKQAVLEWEESERVLEIMNKLNGNQSDEYMSLLTTSMGRCRKAIEHVEVVIKGIERKKKKKQEPWCSTMKGDCQKTKEIFQGRLNALDAVYQNALREKALRERISVLTAECGKRAQLAQIKYQECPRDPQNAAATAAALQEIIQLFEEAALYAHEALAINPADPALRENERLCVGAVEACKQEAAGLR